MWIVARHRVKILLSLLGTNEEKVKMLSKKAKELNDPLIMEMSFSFISKERDLLKIIESSDESIIHEIVLPFLDLKEKTEEELISILRCVNFNKKYLKKILPLINFREKTEEEIIMLLVKVNYQQEFCKASFPYLTNPKIFQILNTVEKEKYFNHLCKEALPFLKLKEQTEKELIAILKKVFYNQKYCKAIVPLLSKSSLIELLKEEKYSEWVIKKILPYLKC